MGFDTDGDVAAADPAAPAARRRGPASTASVGAPIASATLGRLVFVTGGARGDDQGRGGPRARALPGPVHGRDPAAPGCATASSRSATRGSPGSTGGRGSATSGSTRRRTGGATAPTSCSTRRCRGPSSCAAARRSLTADLRQVTLTELEVAGGAGALAIARRAARPASCASGSAGGIGDVTVVRPAGTAVTLQIKGGYRKATLDGAEVDGHKRLATPGADRARPPGDRARRRREQGDRQGRVGGWRPLRPRPGCRPRSRGLPARARSLTHATELASDSGGLRVVPIKRNEFVGAPDRSRPPVARADRSASVEPSDNRVEWTSWAADFGDPELAGRDSRDPEPQPNGTSTGPAPPPTDCVRFAPTHQTRCWRSPAVPQSRTLYEPSTEHDACGFGFVADIAGRASHAIVRDALTVLVNLEHRGASGSEANTGDGAGLLLAIPHRFLRAVAARGRVSASRRAASAWPWCSCRATRPAARAPASASSRAWPPRASQLLGWRDVPTDPTGLGPSAQASQPVIAQAFIARPADLAVTERRRPRLRPPPVRRPAPDREVHRPQLAPRPRRRLRPVDVVPDDGLQGDAQRLPAADLLPRRARRPHRERDRPRPLPVLDQHLPVLGARPPVPLHQPQRRDQHAARERELDVRPPVDVPVSSVRRRPREDPAGGRRRRLRHDDLRQRARAAPPVGPEPRPHDDDDGPRAVGPGHRHVARPARVLRVPRVPDGAVGRAGVARVHRRRPDRRDARPQRPPPGPLLGHPRRPGRDGVGGRRARHRARATWSRRAASSPAGCSSSTRSRAGSSPTTSSRPS